MVLSANAVQAAPVGLAVTISTAAALAGGAAQTSTAIAATKAIAMTTLQKTVIGATLAAAVGTGIYEAGQASRLRNEVQTLQQQQAPLTEQIQRLSRDRTDATRQLATLRDENERLNRNTAELLRLRSEVTKLRPVAQRIAKEHESPVSRNSQEGQVPSTGENAETKMRDLQIDEKLNQLREKIGLRKGAGRPLAETFGQPDVQGRCTVGKIAEIFTRFTCLVRDYPGC